MKVPPTHLQASEEDFYLTELRLLIPNLDFRTLTKLKLQESVSKEDLALLGDIILSSWRSYC